MPQMAYQYYQYQKPLYDKINNDINNEEFLEHGDRGDYGVPRKGVSPRKMAWE